MDGLNISIYEREADRGGRWQARCRRRHQEINTPTGVFTPTDVNHMLPERRRLLVFEVWPANCSGWHLSPHSWIGDRRRSLCPIPIWFDPLESATVRFRSDNRPFSIDAAAVTLQFNCQCCMFIVYLISGGLLMAAALGVSVDAGAPLPPQQH